ncbi:MAG: hypothetical protein AUK24_00980 [Syntrophaceae bacterium CG2_30_49_12]|nr:MAG: hypothetical protein AUK24_00980 [Syntrophaceae bacterium CG2_30_49_12]
MTISFPSGLQHVMEVCRLVCQSHRSRIKAVNEVARTRRVDPQTVTSACTRSLGIGTDDLDKFLLPENSEAFCEHLVRRFPRYQKEIEAFFTELDGKKDQTLNDPLGAIRVLFPDEKKDLLRLVLLHDIRKRFSAWSERHDIPEDIRREMSKMWKQIDKV